MIGKTKPVEFYRSFWGLYLAELAAGPLVPLLFEIGAGAIGFFKGRELSNWYSTTYQREKFLAKCEQTLFVQSSRCFEKTGL